MLAPFTPIILDAAGLTSGKRVLDIGCGCGATTLAAARAVAPGSVLGADLSAPMLDRARADAARAGLANVEFVQADAQVHPFDPASFDAVISRFGVMFFADPVAAFANVRRALRPGRRGSRSPAGSRWPRTRGSACPRSAALEHVPPPPALPADAPGPFALADPDRTRLLLRDAGWHDIDVAPHETTLLLGGPGSLDTAVDFLRTGSTGPDAARERRRGDGDACARRGARRTSRRSPRPTACGSPPRSGSSPRAPESFRPAPAAAVPVPGAARRTPVVSN